MKVLDLFSGIGGFSLGLERAGMETVAFCEFDPHAQAILKKHWPDVPIYEDVRELDATKYRGTIDVVCGGFPCQDLSIAGKKAGFTGERSSLYREMLRVIGECLPRYAVFENVTGLLTGESGRWFAKFLYDLAEIGYDAEWHCISASYLSAPHHRDRVWIIAYPRSNDGHASENEECGEQREEQPFVDLAASSENATNTNTKRCEGFAKIAHNLKQQIELMRSAPNERGRRHLSAPPLCGKDDGLSRPLDRLRRLGNTVYPPIPEAIGRALMKAEER